jgi:hypothetical protein
MKYKQPFNFIPWAQLSNAREERRISEAEGLVPARGVEPGTEVTKASEQGENARCHHLKGAGEARRRAD